MQVAVCILIAVVLTLFVTFNLEGEQKDSLEAHVRELEAQKELENFEIRLNLEGKMITDAIKEDELPWILVGINANPDYEDKTSRDGIVFGEAQELIDWMKAGGIGEDGYEECFASLKKELNGMYVTFFFQRRIKR